MTEKIGQKEFFYQRLGRLFGDFSLSRRKQDLLFDKKWFKFLKFRKKFSRIPFVNIVLGAGSMALGNVCENSDFDVIVGAESGRIFTVRFFCFLAFGRNKKKKPNKVCLSHFVTRESYRLSDPYNLYWKELYKNLIPLYGNRKLVKEFFEANDWAGNIRFEDDLRFFNDETRVKRIIEKILKGGLGNITEKILKNLQLVWNKRKFKKDKEYKPRIIISDTELEFHPDTQRVEELVDGLE